MARVPRLTTPEVRNRQIIVTGSTPGTTRPSTNVRGITPAAFGVDTRGVGEGLQRIGNQLADAAIRIRSEDSERQAKELDLEFQRSKNVILYGDGTDDNPGYYSLSGGAAVDAAPQVQAQLDELRKQFIERSDRPSVQRMFGASADQRLTIDLNNISKHVVQERRTATLATSQARIQGAIDDAARAYNDDDILAQSRSIITSEVLVQAEIEGMSPEVIEQEMVKAYTVLYQNMVRSALANQDVSTATAILSRHRLQMQPDVVATLEAQLQEPQRIARAQSIVDEVMSTGMSETEALANVRAQYSGDPKLRDELVRRIKSRYDENTAAGNAAIKASREDWHGQIVRGEATLDQLIIANPEVWMVLSENSDTVRALQSAQDRLDEGRVYARVSDPDVMNSLADMDRAELAEVDPVTIQSQLTESDYNSWVTRIRSARQALEDDETSSTTFRRMETMLKRMAPPSLEIGQSKQSQDNKRLENRIVHEMDAWISEYISLNGHPPSDPELRDRLTMLLTPTETPRDSWLGSLYEGLGGGGNQYDTYVEAIEKMTPEEKASLRVDIDQVPFDWIEQTKEVFREFGTPEPTDDQIEQYIGAVITENEDRKNLLLGIEPEDDESPLSNLNIQRDN